jgi:hypothetical protein
LRANTFINFVINGEGETAFVEFLDKFIEGNILEARGLSYLNNDGVFVYTPRPERIRELDSLPSPYTTGVFDRLLKEFPDEKWTALWETNRGCPFQCTFCDWGSATASKVNKFSMERLRAELNWFVENKIEFIYCCDANFGILTRDLEIATAVAEAKRNFGYPKIFSVQSTKNSTKKSLQTQQIITAAGLTKGVSLSMQSLSPIVLERIKRDNIHQDTYDQLQSEFTLAGIETYSDLIIGLPGETLRSFIDGIDYLIANGQINRIRFNNLTVLPNSEVGDKTYQSVHGIQLKRIPVVHVYGEQDEIKDDVCEYQDLVVGTDSAFGEDWVRIRAYAFTVDFLFFNKLIFIPLLFLTDCSKRPVSYYIEKFLFTQTDFRIIESIKRFFIDKARSMQHGDVEYCYGTEYLKTYWKSDEFQLISLVKNGELGSLWNELRLFLLSVLDPSDFRGIEGGVLELAFEDALRITQHLYRLPISDSNRPLNLRLSTNLFDWYQAKTSGHSLKDFKLKVLPTSIVIAERESFTLDDWMRQVVWYGNRTGAYLTPLRTVATEKG